jgi:hypothetical protein
VSGRKTFVAGEILTASDVNGFLMDQSVMVFDDSTARGSAIPTPTEGMVTYRKDTKLVEAFNGTAFTPVGNVLQVVSTAKDDTFTTTSTSFVDVTGLSASITPSSSSNKVLVSVVVPVANNNIAEGFILTVTDSSNNAIFSPSSPGSRSVAMNRWVTAGNMFNGVFPQTFVFLHSPGTTSSYTYKVRGRVSGSTGFVNRSETDTDNGNFPRTVSTITLMEVAA